MKVYKKLIKKKSEFEPNIAKTSKHVIRIINCNYPYQMITQVVAAVRATKKLTIDSEQQERREQEQRQRLEQIQKRKEEKRRRREQAEREQMQRIKQQQQREKRYDQPQMMFVQDSDQGVDFKRVVKKIKRLFPSQVNNFQAPPKKKNFIVPDDEDEDQSESGEYDDEEGSSSVMEQESNHNKKGGRRENKGEVHVERKEKKVVERKQQVEKKRVVEQQQQVVKKEKVKIQAKSSTSDRKQQLAKQVSVRWWYALPQWPPVDFDYTGKLRSLGYRCLNADKFKLQPQIVNGLQKVLPVDGYLGVYKSKTKIIDIRPKQSAPTMNNFRAKSTQQLVEILKTALTNQIQELKQVRHQQRGEKELVVELERQLNRLK